MGMYFSSPEELKEIVPVQDGIWNKEYLYEYLVWSANIRFKEYINRFFGDWLADEGLADMLFSFLLNDDYDGSDCQIGAARLIARMDRRLLRDKKELLLRAQCNEVHWKRPFPDAESLAWLV
ncbi:MAG: hypothetical protein NC337_08555 [Roseburia sp.]|nr:hypothetical protein [Roseburia sp.]